MADSALSRFNGIVGSVYSLDQALRLVSYSGLLLNQLMTKYHFGDEKLAAALLDFFNRATDARFVNRLFGIPATLEGVLTTGEGSIQSFLSKLMALSMLVYYPLEHTWWLTTLKPRILQVNGDKISMWSSRAWVVYIVLDLLKTLLRLRELRKLIKKDEESTGYSREKKFLHQWVKLSLCDLSMACHWSIPNGPLPPILVTFLGIYGGAGGLWLKWLKSMPQKKQKLT